MALFTSKVDYALRALLDLAAQPSGRPAQSREIAARQDIPESYLNQLLVILRRAGLIRSVRGACGGYVLGRDPGQLTAGDVMRALHGDDYLADLQGNGNSTPEGGCPAAWVVRNFQGRLNSAVWQLLAGTTLANLHVELQRLDESQ